MKALVTGGVGGLGLHLARRLLSEGAEVDLLDRVPPDALDADAASVVAVEGCRYVARDIREAASTLSNDYTHIFHLAALLGVERVSAQPFETLRDNADLTFAAVELAQRQTRLDRVLFASTSEVYAGTLETVGMRIPTPEETVLALPDLSRPRTSYMLSKLVGEAAILYSGAPYTIVRPHNLYGPRMGLAHAAPQMLRRAYRSTDGDVFEVPSAEHTRAFCFVEDGVELLWRMCTRPEAEGRTLNLGAEGPEISMAAFADIVCNAVGRMLVVKPTPPTAGSPARRAPDMALTAEVCGWRAETPLAEGLARTFAWYRTHVFDADEPGAVRT